MKSVKNQTIRIAITLAIAFGVSAARADSPLPGVSSEYSTALASALQQEINLGGNRAPGVRYYDMETSLTHFDANGTRGDKSVYRMKIKSEPLDGATDGSERYTCKQFIHTQPSGKEASIPALEGWSYPFKISDTGLDEKGQVFGIDHARFRGLENSKGVAFKSDQSYLIYNTFIDFHGFCDLFAVPSREGKGVQHLTQIGQSVTLDASHSSPPVNLGAHVKKGSYFKNGVVTLSLKGLSLVDGAPCAVVEFNSGDASFMMLMEPMPGMEVKTLGGSHYFGDIYIDLETHWPRKVVMRELVICETDVPMAGGTAPMKIGDTIERQSTIMAVTREAYERD